MKKSDQHRMRRRMLKGIAGGALLPLVARAQLPTATRPPLLELVPVLKDITNGAPVRESRVKLDIPHLAENGPMTQADHVRALYLLAEKNPRPLIAKISLSPGAGRAMLTTRIRLSSAQYVVAVAQMSDGSFWAASADVIVTETACLDATDVT